MALAPPETPSDMGHPPVLGMAASPVTGAASASGSPAVHEVPGATWQLVLSPAGPCLPVLPGQTLWQALAAGGVSWPVSCRNGSCRTCIGLLLEGQVRYTVEWPGLLPEEKMQGCVLPCVACAQTDVVLARP